MNATRNGSMLATIEMYVHIVFMVSFQSRCTHFKSFYCHPNWFWSGRIASHQHLKQANISRECIRIGTQAGSGRWIINWLQRYGQHLCDVCEDHHTHTKFSQTYSFTLWRHLNSWYPSEQNIVYCKPFIIFVSLLIWIHCMYSALLRMWSDVMIRPPN